MSGDPARETIFAPSSGSPPAAIAIVRISGPAASEAMRSLAGSLPAPRVATLRWLRDAEGTRLDQALLLWFPGPTTATGEDLGELHLHGGKAVVAAVLTALAQVPGCRPATAGEFTRRAFDNGRIDLLQAEGLADLLAAETEVARRRALHLAEGGLSRLMEGWRTRLLALAARAEAVLEFGGDDPDIAEDPLLQQELAALEAEMHAALAQPPAERARDGVRIVVAGPPNAGKSTLVNRLAGREVALATPIPGTTRDLIEAPVIIEGIPMILTDSAGLRDAEDIVEQLGVDRARQALASADIVLWLGAGDAPIENNVVRVHTKADCGLPHTGIDHSVSAHTGQGIAALQQDLVARGRNMVGHIEGLSLEQRKSIISAASDVGQAQRIRDEAVVSDLLRTAVAALDELTGRLAVEDFLTQIFSRFCVGK